MRRVVRRVRQRVQPLSLGGSYVSSNGRSRGAGAIAALDYGYGYSDLGRMVDRSAGADPPDIDNLAVNAGLTPSPVVVVNVGGGGADPYPAPLPGQIDTRSNGGGLAVLIDPVPPGTPGAGTVGSGTTVDAAMACRARYGWAWNGTACVPTVVNDPGPRPPPPLGMPQPPDFIPGTTGWKPTPTEAIFCAGGPTAVIVSPDGNWYACQIQKAPPVQTPPDMAPPAVSDIPWGWLLAGGVAAYLFFGRK